MSDFNPTELAKRDSDRIRGYQELLRFYHGEHWEGQARWGETRLTFNYAKVIIDKVTSYLMSGITFAVDPRATPRRRVKRPGVPSAPSTGSTRRTTWSSLTLRPRLTRPSWATAVSRSPGRATSAGCG